jgi:MFS family permease
VDNLATGINRARPLLGHQAFRRLWAAQFLAVTAVYAQSLAAITLVEQRAHSNSWNAVAIMAAILPAFLGSMVAGAVVDRLDRLVVLRASHLGRALVGLAFWGAAQYLPSGWVLATALAANAIMALLTQFAMTAEFASLPELVGRPRLIPANTLLQSSMILGEGLGAILLAPLISKAFGFQAVGLLAAVLCALALVLVLAVSSVAGRVPHPAGQSRDLASLGADLRAGWGVIAKDRVLTLVTLQATVAAALLLVLVALLPGLASRHLGMGAENVPFLLLPGGLGFVLGLVLVNRRPGRPQPLAWIGWGMVGLGIGIALLAAASGSATRLVAILPSFLIIGLSLSVVIILARTVLQERPPAELRGRVIAAQLALGNAAAVLPLLLGGRLADQVGIRPVLALMALAALTAGIAGTRAAYKHLKQKKV